MLWFRESRRFREARSPRQDQLKYAKQLGSRDFWFSMTRLYKYGPDVQAARITPLDQVLERSFSFQMTPLSGKKSHHDADQLYDERAKPIVYGLLLALRFNAHTLAIE